MRSPLPALLLLSLACSHPVPAAAPAAAPASLESGDAAAYASDYALARKQYAAVEGKDRDVAQIHLANIEWRIDRAPDAAAARLRPIAERTGGGDKERSRALHEWMRAERSRKHYAQAEALERRAVEAGKTADEKRNARVSLAKIILEAQRNGTPVGTPAEAFAIVKEVVTEESGRVVPSLLLVDAALLTGDGPAALQGWRSYYGGAIDSPLLADARRTLEAKLPSWHGGNDAELADALTASRLFEEATLVTTPAERPELFRYASFLRDITKVTDDYYRDVARRQGKKGAWQHALEARAQAWWRESHPNGPKYSQEAFENELDHRYGTQINLGDTGGVADMHAGHRVVDERRPVEQYGHKATVRFVQLDTMISNGFESWSRDGSSEHGGWGSASNIVQVRPAYADAPARIWRRRTDPELRAKADQEIATESGKDWERAAKNPYAYLPGLAQRMKRDAELRMIARSGSRNAFLAEYASAVTESSIFAHEGRHAIDDQYEKIHDNAELEYRAKLSEIAFAPDPKLAITSGIVAPGIGDDTPHGNANLKIMKGLVAWMDAHRASIVGLDPARPLLPQLDKLTDDQLREAARGMDPYAKK
ncbi:MAG: hypothetical protein JWO56_1598 [Acidobacteria bacterium]|nr:hypothetical protein [Acidobacteriota bacterium]